MDLSFRLRMQPCRTCVHNVGIVLVLVLLAKFSSLPPSPSYVYMCGYIYMFMCACVCVCTCKGQSWGFYSIIICLFVDVVVLFLRKGISM